MSTWTVRVPGRSTEPVDISTDNPRFAGVYSSLGPGQKVYSLPDAMRWISYRMKSGDTVVTVAPPPPVGPVCPACGQECQGSWEDFGIGRYDYWGAPGVDVRMAYVSTCCEAQLPEPERPDDG